MQLTEARRQDMVRLLVVFTLALFVLPLGMSAQSAPESPWSNTGEVFLPSDEATTDTADSVTFILPASGAEIVVAPGVVPDDPAESDFADQILLNLADPTSFGAVAVLPAAGNPGITLRMYIAGFAAEVDSVVSIDQQLTSGLAYDISAITVNGVDLFMYVSVDAISSPGNHVIEVLIAPDAVFADGIVELRDNVFIDGNPMFSSLDENGIQQEIDGYSE